MTITLPTSHASPSFITTDLDLAAYLKTVGQRLVGTQRQGRFIAFMFESSAQADAERYQTGASAPARGVLANYRELRTLIVNSERKQKNYVYESNVSFN